MRFKCYSQSAIIDMHIDKGALIEKALIDKVTFDYALPQNTLDNFIDDSALDYSFVLATTVYVYDDTYTGMFSACYEVQRLIENLEYCRKENGND